MEPSSKKRKVTQRYREGYSKEWPCFIKSRVNDSYVYCTVCACNFSIAHGGRDDCRRHFESKKHKDFNKLQTQSKPIDNFFKNSSGNEVTKAEMLFASFIIEHNIPIASTEHAAPLFRAMFPDSKIAKQYSSSRTKTTSIIKSMSRNTEQHIIDILKRNPFSLATDGSTDMNNVKLYPIVVSFFDDSLGKIVTMLLSILESTDNTGEGIFNVINSEFEKKGIPWKNCISFACDNTNTMVGQFKGVAAFIKKVQPAIIIQGCSCHYIHLAAKKATAELKQVNVEQFLVQLFYYLDKSSKRKNALKLCQSVCGTKPHKILKYVSTRWLSMLESINRALEQWEPLQKYFCAENDDSPSLTSALQNPMLKLYCLFLSNTLPLFVNVNVSLQQEAPAIHVLQRQLINLMTNLLCRFIKPPKQEEQDKESTILDIQFKKKKFQKDDCDLIIGAKTRAYIKETKFSEQQLAEFYLEVRNFYQKTCEYIHKKFPLKNEILKHSEIADVKLQKEVRFSSVEYIADKFKVFFTVDEIGKLEEEFAQYQFEDLGHCIKNVDSRMDSTWNELSKLTDASGIKKYSVLSKLMLAILLIPHSNAFTERVFSIVTKNKTEFRPNLSTETLCALLVEKTKALTNTETCYEKKFSDEQIKLAKQSTRLDLSK